MERPPAPNDSSPRLPAWVEARWGRIVALIWLATLAALLIGRWGNISWFALGDTDDNMRMMQVRGLLHGQAWFDLRQHRLDPAFGGANIHWSRLVDLPIAALILILRPIAGGPWAERLAVGIAPVLPLWLALWASALAARRLIAPAAFALAPAILLCAGNAMLMWMPERIDHHGWQLALLLAGVAASADPRPARGGLWLGASSAAGLAIGLEMMPYIALLAALTALRWAADREQADRIAGYGAALALGCAIGFAGFASWDNRGAVCDALSPVWLSAAIGGGALLVGLSYLRIESARTRLVLVVLAGAIVAAGFALAWPQCLGRPERVSPELDRLWLSHVREARPVYTHGWRVAWPIVGLPIAGIAGSALATWFARGSERFQPWLAATLLASVSAGLLLWQTRAAPAAQVLAVPGAAALVWMALPWLVRQKPAFRIAGAAAGVLVGTGLLAGLIVDAVPEPPPAKSRAAANRANARCPTLTALRPVGLVPAATVLTFVDLGPRLITLTHHDAIAGPYHRNGQAILDIHHAFRSPDPEVAHEVMRRHKASLLLLCPGMSESTIYASEASNGFYAQLVAGRVPAWLSRVPLPAESPYRLWRLVG